MHRNDAPGETAEVPGNLCEALATKPPDVLQTAGGAVAMPVSITYWWPWGGPHESHVQAVAQRLARDLRDAEPHRRYLVTHAFAPELSKQTAWVRTYRAGTVTVRRELDGQTPAILAAKVADEELHEPTHVLGSGMTTALTLAMPFATKLGAWVAIAAAAGTTGRGFRFAPPAEPPAEPAAEEVPVADTDAELEVEAAAPPPALPLEEIGETLLAALLADLACEQMALLHRRWGGPACGFAACLPLLEQLAATRVRERAVDTDRDADATVAPAAPQSSPLVRLVATLRFLADAQAPVWERLPPLSWLRAAPRLRRAVHAKLDALVAASVPAEARPAFDMALRRERKQLDARARQAVRDSEAVDTRAFALELLMAPFDAASVRTNWASCPRPRCASSPRRRRRRPTPGTGSATSGAARRRARRRRRVKSSPRRARPPTCSPPRRGSHPRRRGRSRRHAASRRRTRPPPTHRRRSSSSCSTPSPHRRRSRATGARARSEARAAGRGAEPTRLAALRPPWQDCGHVRRHRLARPPPSTSPSSPMRRAPPSARAEGGAVAHGGGPVEIPMVIGGQEVRTERAGGGARPTPARAGPRPRARGRRQPRRAGDRGGAGARTARGRRSPWTARAAVFLKAADLLAATWRQKLNAATMLGQSKTAYQAEIDAACELIDFLRFNVAVRPAHRRASSRSQRARHAGTRSSSARSRASSSRSRRSTSPPSPATSRRRRR